MAVSTGSVSAATEAADREVVFTRVYDAPRELVFEAWTDPKHLTQWWGPKGLRPRFMRWTCGRAACGGSSCMGPTASTTTTESFFSRL
jgi:uncharacterized protein YndB with AHSA1/START domain